METTSGASLSLYMLEAMVPNYHALVLTDRSLPCWTEDGQSSWFSSVRNSTGIRMAYSRLPALHDWFSDCTYVLVPSDSVFYQPVLCGCTRSTYSAYLPPSYPRRLCRYDVSNFLAKASCYIRPTLPTVPLRVCVTLSTLARFTCFHLHKVPRGPPPSALRAGSGQTHGRDVYGVIGCVQLLVIFSVGMQPRRLQ